MILVVEVGVYVTCSMLCVSVFNTHTENTPSNKQTTHLVHQVLHDVYLESDPQQ